MATHVTAPARLRVQRVPGLAAVRAAAAGGFVFFALILVNSQFRTGAPSATDPGQEILGYISRHQGRFQLAAVALGFAMPAALLWLSGLFRLLRNAEGGRPALAFAALGGGVLAAASTVTGALIEGATAARIGDLSADGAQFWWSLFLMSTGGTLLGLTLMIGITAFACLRSEVLARWFIVASGFVAAISAVGAFTIGYASDGIQVVAGAAILLDSVWILLVSVFLWRDPGRALD